MTCILSRRTRDTEGFTTFFKGRTYMREPSQKKKPDTCSSAREVAPAEQGKHQDSTAIDTSSGLNVGFASITPSRAERYPCIYMKREVYATDWDSHSLAASPTSCNGDDTPWAIRICTRPISRSTLSFVSSSSIFVILATRKIV